MKKVLFGTTALVLSSGVAFADAHGGVSLSGYAEIGVADNGVDDLQFHQDVEVTFSMSGETDNGLSFGVSVQLDEGGTSGAGTNPNDDQGYAVFVSGEFGTITMGDTDGALDWALTEVGSLSSIADDHTSHIGYSGNSALDGTNDGQVLRYDNSIGDVSFALSFEQDVNGGANGDVIGVGVKFSAGSIGVGLGYQENDATDVVGVSVTADLGGIATVLNYWDGAGDTYTAVGATYTSGDLSMTVNYGEFDSGADGFGLAANYDLGGGATAMLGYGSENSAGEAQWSAGLGLSF